MATTFFQPSPRSYLPPAMPSHEYAAQQAQAKADAAAVRKYSAYAKQAAREEAARQGRELADYNTYIKSVKLLEQRQAKAKADLLKLMESKKYDPKNPTNNARVDYTTRAYNNYRNYISDRYGDKYDKYVAPAGVKARGVSTGNPLSYIGKTSYSRPTDLAGVVKQLSDWNLMRQPGALDRNSVIADRAKKYGIDYTPPTPTKYTPPDNDPTTNVYYQPYSYQPAQQDTSYQIPTPQADNNNKKGGMIKSPAKTTNKTSSKTASSKTTNKASSRGDGIAQRGKTRGTMR